MKIEKLTDNKIRIILNIDDLAKRNIDIHSLIKNTDSTQVFFKKILKQAQKEVNFDVDDSKLLIEAFISADGFFVLTFTKINNSFNKKRPVISKPKRKNFDIFSPVIIYDFTSFDEFCNFCTYINNSKLGNLKKFAKNISLYEYASKYFLVFEDVHKDYEFSSLFYTLISEFAKLSSNSIIFARKLDEFGNVIFKRNAIQHGINYFSKT